jgi:hypothetical protein
MSGKDAGLWGDSSLYLSLSPYLYIVTNHY